IMDAYAEIDEEKLWENLTYFIKRIIPEAEAVGVKMAIHPDDPPYSIFGLPRIITGLEAIERFVKLYDSKSNGITLCVGSYASEPQNDVLEISR
ncbi:mannonate dehydratase, partial [Streptococcus sp. SPC0]|nr:mannonate dehydratase [Streptococcus sp. SPC0]